MPMRYAQFGPQLAAAMGEAFEVAWSLLKTTTAEAEVERVREMLATRIIETAQGGQHDPVMLSQDAIAYLARGVRTHKTRAPCSACFTSPTSLLSTTTTSAPASANNVRPTG